MIVPGVPLLGPIPVIASPITGSSPVKRKKSQYSKKKKIKIEGHDHNDRARRTFVGTFPHHREPDHARFSCKNLVSN